jgi:hypothetical protein
MRNETKIEKILQLIKKLPYFDLNTLFPIETNKTYLKILFSLRILKNFENKV